MMILVLGEYLIEALLALESLTTLGFQICFTRHEPLFWIFKLKHSSLQAKIMLRKILYWFLLGIAHLCNGQVHSTPLHFDQLTISNGLSHNTIYCILQDQNGYIWIGTQNGLNKYDGYTFEVYQSSEIKKNTEGFKGKSISALFEDRSANLWVGTKKQGINFKAKKNDRFVNLQSDSAFFSIKGIEISSFFEDKSDNIWITTVGAGVLKYNPKTGISKIFNHKNSHLTSDVVFDLVEDKYGTIWVATAGGGLNYLTADDKFKTSHAMLPNNPNMSGYQKKLLLDDEYLWLGTQGTGLYKMNLKDKNYIRFEKGEGKRAISSNAVMDLLIIDDEKLFIATDGNGLNIYDKNTQEISFYGLQSTGQAALNSNALLCMLEDRTGNIWIGTYNGGISIYKPNKTWFDFYVPNLSGNNDLSHHSILSILQSKNGEILVGTDGGGLNWLNQNHDNFETSSFINNPTDPNSIGGNVVKTMLEDSKGQIWIGLFAGGLDLYNPTTKTFEHFMWWRPNVWSLAERKNGKLLVATLGDGLHVIDLQTKDITKFQFQSENIDHSIDKNIMTVFVDEMDRVWIGSLNNGLVMIDEKHNTYAQFKHNPKDSFSISNDEIRTIFQDSDGEIWIGTEGGGVNRWLGEGRFDQLRKKDGLIANSVMGISEDKIGNIWMTTFKGISRLNKKNNTITNFNFRTAQNTNQFNQDAILTDADGKLYFGGINGLHTIRPDKVVENNYQPEIIFTDLKIHNKSVPIGKLKNGRIILKEPIETSSDIWLSYLDQSFTIFFNAIDYTNPLENEFAFQLEGFSENWEYTSAGQRSATFTNLDAGTYVFKIKHKEKIVSVNVHIQPPFWKTLWFRFLAIIFSLGVIFSGLYFWIKRREASAKRIILQLKNEKLATEIEAKNSKLMFSSVQMAHKNEILTEVKKDLIEFEKNPAGNFRSLVRKLDYELKNEDYWKEFNLYFNEVDQKFLDRIIKKHPNLTKNDLRMCSLLRMNLSTKEIASLLNISVRAVEQSRYRLKKRLDLDKNNDLLKYISSFHHQK